MALGLVGRKCGMTRIFTEEGVSIPVSVIQITPNRVAQIKTPEIDGYRAIQVTMGTKPASRVDKAMAGHFAKANVGAGEGLWEFRVGEGESQLAEGGEINIADIFKVGQVIDVTGTSKGKGFQGTVKRHNFSMQDATHGNSLSHRVPGSIGQRQTPGRVFPGKKMSGQMGNVRCTTQNQTVVQIDTERHLLLVSGAIPGAPGGVVIVKPAAKTKKAKGGN